MTDFHILGPLEVRAGEGLVGVAGARQRALLAILVLHAGEVVSSDRLMDELWEDAPPRAGTAALRVRVSQLRRALGPAGELLVTRPPGYVLAVDDERVDLRRFERLTEEGEDALARGDPDVAAERLRTALALWRGPPLADFAYAPFAQSAIVRLEELRLAAVELRVEAELALGRHARLVGELRALVGDHPLRERLHGLLMLALYRDGRQAEALDAYRAARHRLVEEIGLEPGPELQELERRILAQDAGLRTPTPTSRARRPTRVVLVLAGEDGQEPDALVRLALPLAIRDNNELMIAGLVADGALLARRSARLDALRADAEARGATTRVAAFTSTEPGADALRLAAEEHVALLLLGLPEITFPQNLGPLLCAPVCDLALVAGADRARQAPAGPVVVPFGGHEHDWAAAELGAWFAAASAVPLRLVGTHAIRGRRDASRLLGHASLALQRAVGISAEPVLAAPGTAGIVAAAGGAALVVVGLSERFAREGLGAARQEIADRAPAPVVLVRRGLRPGGLAPSRALTRFTWSAG